MSHYRIALVGFGNVGQALAKLLVKKRGEIQRRYGITFSVTGIATGSRGAAIDHNGLDIERALEIIADNERSNFVDIGVLSRKAMPRDTFEFIHRCGADVLFENSPVNYITGKPGLDHIQQALTQRMHVVTANKGPVVHGYQNLSQLAEKNNVKFYFESTVMDGAPIFSIFRETLPGANLLSFRGILNSTTNMILSQMETGLDFESAVAHTQRIGIAETDPSGDIDGWDAAVKVAALVTVLMETPLKPQQVERNGIREITREEVAKGLQNGKRWKLICAAKREMDGVKARVALELVGSKSPFYQIDGTTSIIQFETDMLGLFTIIEEDPGPETTAYGCLADFLNIARRSPGC